MGYYTRVLTTSKQCVPLTAIRHALRKDGLTAQAEIQSGDADDWEQIILRHPDGLEIASIERNVVEERSLGQEEIAEFIEEIQDVKPASGAKWLRSFLPSVRCIYAFQHLSGAEKGHGFECLTAVRNAIWRAAPAILQADGEGFSNEAGYHILWQFSESVTGTWWMGVLQDKKWIHFQMDLSDPKHREAFLAGVVPKGAKPA
jgi:hypothetical protein